MASLDTIFLGDRANTTQAVIAIPAAAAQDKPGVLLLQAVSDAGAVSDYYIWVDSNGKIRYHTSLPTDQNANGYILNNDVILTTRLDSVTQTSDLAYAVSPVAGYLKAVYAVANAAASDTMAVEIYCATASTAATTLAFATDSVYCSTASITQHSTLAAGSVVKALISNASTLAGKVTLTFVVSPTG